MRLFTHALFRLFGRAASIFRNWWRRTLSPESTRSLNAAIALAALIVGTVKWCFCTTWSGAVSKANHRVATPGGHHAGVANHRHPAEARQLWADVTGGLSLGLRL